MPENLHPLFVHFPIALLLSSVALSWAGRFWPGKGLDQAAWYTLLLGLAGTVVTLLSGLVAAQGVPADSPAMATLNIHRALGIATFVIFGALAIWSWRSKGVISGSGRLFYSYHPNRRRGVDRGRRFLWRGVGLHLWRRRGDGTIMLAGDEGAVQ